MSSRLSGPSHPQWKGGKHTNDSGYVVFNASANGRSKPREHVVIVERVLGKRLPVGAEVHHVNGIRTDNRNENLVVCQDNKYHKLLHRRQRALEACGDANAHRCTLCSGYDRQENITVVVVQRSGTFVAYHRSCQAARFRRYRIERRDAGRRIVRKTNGKRDVAMCAPDDFSQADDLARYA